MIGPDSLQSPDGSSYGVFTWMPPVALITDLDARFAQTTEIGAL
jgi:hypothetical protein